MNGLRNILAAGICLTMGMPVASAKAQPDRPVLMDSFRIGSGNGALCQAQSNASDAALGGMFDRAWTVVCRDSPRPVGQIYAFRDAGPLDAPALMKRLATSRGAEVECGAEGGASIPDVGSGLTRNCTLTGNGTPYRITRIRHGRFTYVAQGVANYDSALELGLRSVIADRIIPGEVRVATLGGADAIAFARLQAAAADPKTVLAEGYRRNNAGNYAEAAEFFDSLEDRLAKDVDETKLSQAERSNRHHEYVVNRALQLSNLGEFAQADALFARASADAVNDPVQTRLRRNFEAMHRLNQRDYAGARAILDRPVPEPAGALEAQGGAVTIGPRVAAEINSSAAAQAAPGVRQDAALTPEERAAIIDAQALQLRGTLLRLDGKPAEARTLLERALSDATVIRDGRVTSITRLRAQLLAEIALTQEAQGNFGAAETLLNQGLALLAAQYPETVALNGARARLGAFLIRRARNDEAIALYRTIVASTVENRTGLTGMSNQLQPYFSLLADQIAARPELAADLFLASQTLVRPGAADTLAVLSRELSAGSDEAARLFRQSLSLSRDIERGRIALAQIRETEGASGGPLATAKQAEIDALAEQQLSTLSALAAYPQYRAIAKDVLTLADMQAALKPGEAYLKLAQLGDAVYAIWIDANGATGYRAATGGAALQRQVTALRETISTQVSGVQATYPLDLDLARGLYLNLFGPVEARLASVSHLIFEPDGAMLQLPVNLLIADQAGVDAYKARIARPGADEFDFRGIRWLGRDHGVSTALSARAFRDARRAAPSAATRDYIGFGENAPTAALRPASLVRGGSLDAECNWPAEEWSHPISAAELRQAATSVGASGSELVTGSAFTDDAIRARTDLSGFRILHFATHGLVTAPRPQCPARPALLTSFGRPGASDGLLQFSEIFDLKLDADLIILSACDTAGQASLEATRAAGVTTGGGGALDGLVRAFIGAGGRSVIASHWPAPDEYKATERLIAGLFTAGRGETVAEALRRAQLPLMDQAQTSHPFYWSGFAVIGDGARPLIARR